MRVFWRCLLLLLSLAPVCSAMAAAPNDLEAVTEEWPPYQFTAANGQATGINVEIVRAVLAEAGLPADIHIYPWARAYYLGEHRPGTLIFSMARNRARESGFLWIGELMRRNDWFYRARGRESIAPTSVEEIKTCCTVCVERKDIAEDDLQRLGFQPNRHYVASNSFTDCMRLVQKGALPLLIDSPQHIAWALKSNPDLHGGFQQVIPLPLSEAEPFYLAASQGTAPATVARLRAAFATLQQSGRLEAIQRQFLEHNRP